MELLWILNLDSQSMNEASLEGYRKKNPIRLCHISNKSALAMMSISCVVWSRHEVGPRRSIEDELRADSGPHKSYTSSIEHFCLRYDKDESDFSSDTPLSMMYISCVVQSRHENGPRWTLFCPGPEISPFDVFLPKAHWRKKS